MTWFYVDGGRQNGPVTDEQLQELLRSGKIGVDTLIWREGMPDWQPYRLAKPIGGSRGAPTMVTQATWPGVQVPGAVCAGCGGTFAIEEMVRHGDVYVCANCRPAFEKKLGMGATIGDAGEEGLTEERVLQAEYKIDIGEALERAWNGFTQNAGSAIGTTIVVGVVFMVCWGIAAAVGSFIPLANTLLTFLYAVPLMSGLLWFFLRLTRSEQAGLGDAFAGFSRQYGQLVMFGIFQFMIMIVCALPTLITAFAIGLGAAIRSYNHVDYSQFSHLAVGGVLALLGAGFVSFCCVIYFNTLLTYALLLILDKNYDFWSAVKLSWRMVLRRWWMTFLFILVASVIQVLGFVFCFLGAVVTVPLCMGMKAVLYDDNFRSLTPKS